MSAPNRILEASARVEGRLAALNKEALRRLTAATGIDANIAHLYQSYKTAGFHAGILSADEALTVCNALNKWGFRAEIDLPLRIAIVEAMAIVGRGVTP